MINTQIYTLTILEVLENAAAANPNKVVYSCPEAPESIPKELTFGELASTAKKIGLAVVDTGIQPGNPVAVLTGRHVLTPACYLGVAYSGCFYAPMDSDLPEKRLLQIIELTKPKVILTDRDNLERTKSIVNENVKILVLEDILAAQDDESLLSENGESINPDLILSNIRESITPDSPLYMIFTSGSSGVPKGVVTSHRALFTYLMGLNNVIRLTSSDVLGNQSPLDYIAAIRDMYLPLLTGASTVIIPRNIIAMPQELFQLLNDYQVTTLCWSATGLEVIAQLGALEDDTIQMPGSISTIVFSGSVISSKALRKWQLALPKARFINQYGPTETTASCTYYEIPEVVQEDEVLPIGKAFEGYQVFLLDPDTREPVEDGLQGEICVSGAALALKYYNNPEQTNEAFADIDGQRVYFTGDLGKLMPDGNLEFLGRKDRQVKHFGHRVELSEVEHIAQEVDGIVQGVSTYDQEKSLLYLFYTGEAEPRDITLHFRNNAPSYMIPRCIIRLEEMPTLHNGKLDMPAIKKLMK